MKKRLFFVVLLMFFLLSCTPDMTSYEVNLFDGDTLLQTIEVKKDDTLESVVGKFKTPTKAGFSFEGWYLDEAYTKDFDTFVESISESLSLYAKWKPIEAEAKIYSVHFNTNGGSHIAAIDVEENKAIKKPVDPTKADYTFEGWFSDEALTLPFNFETLITQDITLYAKWKAVEVVIEKFTVSFETNGGGTIDSVPVEKGKTVTKPVDPTKENYTFEGWFSDEALTLPFNFETLITQDITLYAKWEAVIVVEKFTVSFKTNGGSEIAPMIVELGSVIERPIDPIKVGHTFENYYSDADLTTVYDFT